jgi:membrane protease YdiL (CAAX protease family)
VNRTDIKLLFDRHGDLRSGWRIVLFMVVTVTAGVVLLSPLIYLPWGLSALESLGVLLAASVGTWVMTRFVNRKPFTAVGLTLRHTALKECSAGVLLGFLMMTGIFLVGVALGMYHPSFRGLSAGTSVSILGGSLFIFAAGAMGEEMLFRGYAYQTLVQGVTVLPATLLMASVFALAHLQNPNVTFFSILNVALAGIVLSFAYVKTRALWLPFGIHFAWNFSQTTLYGLPTSGITSPDQMLILTGSSGAAWISGGEFGPEGGILATIALVSCGWYILKENSLVAPGDIVTLDSVEDLLPDGGEAR